MKPPRFSDFQPSHRADKTLDVAQALVITATDEGLERHATPRTLRSREQSGEQKVAARVHGIDPRWRRAMTARDRVRSPPRPLTGGKLGPIAGSCQPRA